MNQNYAGYGGQQMIPQQQQQQQQQQQAPQQAQQQQQLLQQQQQQQGLINQQQNMMFTNQQQIMGPQRGQEYIPQQRMQPGATRPPYLQVPFKKKVDIILIKIFLTKHFEIFFLILKLKIIIYIF